jgi:hypothetical protein
MAKILISLSVLFLTLSAVFGVLNTNKARELRQVAERSAMGQAEAEQVRIAKEKELQTREAKLAATAQIKGTDRKVQAAEAELIKLQSEKADLQTKLQARENDMAELQKRLAEGGGAKELTPDSLPMPGAGDLETQLEETRRQLDNAEREKEQLSSRIHTTEDRTTVTEAPKRKVAISRKPEVRGTVLAVNHAYNFVVLNLGGRQGVEANSEMLVLRRGALIGKIRVSSVEPATAIGDIITKTLARGVQVQPGDTVIYAGTNS